MKNVLENLIDLIFQDDATIWCNIHAHYNCKAQQYLQEFINIWLGCNELNVQQSDFNISFYRKMNWSVHF